MGHEVYCCIYSGRRSVPWNFNVTVPKYRNLITNGGRGEPFVVTMGSSFEYRESFWY